MRKILFVCAENAGRSQMAEAFFNLYAKGSDWIGESSGMIPAQQVNPIAIEVMREKGIDIKDARPKKFDSDGIRQYHRVISFGCLVKEAFPKNIQKRIEEWAIDDITDKPLEEMRKIRDEIEMKIKELLLQLKRENDSN